MTTIGTNITRAELLAVIAKTGPAFWAADVINADDDEADHSVAWAWIRDGADDAELAGGYVIVRHPVVTNGRNVRVTP